MATRNNKQVKIYNPRDTTIEIPVAQPHQHMTHSPQRRGTVVTFPLFILTVAFVLFLLAFAGGDIGNVLGYLVIPAAAIFPAMLVWEKFGKAAGIFFGLLIIAILAPAYGQQTIANSVSFFHSLQRISQGILVFLSISAFFASIATFVVGIRRARE